MKRSLTSNGASPVPKGTEDDISEFVRVWEERQQTLTVNQAARKKARREWQDEQERARQEARSKYLSERSTD